MRTDQKARLERSLAPAWQNCGAAEAGGAALSFDTLGSSRPIRGLMERTGMLPPRMSPRLRNSWASARWFAELIRTRRIPA